MAEASRSSAAGPAAARRSVPAAAERLGAIVARLHLVANRQLFAFTWLWVMAGGLLLQLVVLPNLIGWAHAGDGLILDLDSVNYDALAVSQAARIAEEGWSAWELRPHGQVTVGLASILYTLVYPTPWVMLPLNALLFAITVVSVRRMLARVTDSPGVALAALLPFFLFPSFVPIWGQLQKDVLAGAGLAVVLAALVRTEPQARAVALRGAAAAAAGILLVWLARPYGVVVIAGAALAAVAVLASGRGCRRPVILVVPALAVSGAILAIEPWQLQQPLPANPDAPVLADRAAGGPPDEATSERLARTLSRISAACAPEPSSAVLDRLLFSLCSVRATFIGHAEDVAATSGFDYDVRLRTAGDVVGYLPRAVAYTMLAPAPPAWGRERTPVGRLASVFVPIEMSVAYLAFALGALTASRRRLDPRVWAIATFCILYSLCFAYATPQLGTVYRMRAFAFAIVVSTALAVWLRRVIPHGDT